LPEAQRRAIELAGGEHAQLVLHAAVEAMAGRSLARIGRPAARNQSATALGFD
jgi:hypothetical protein